MSKTPLHTLSALMLALLSGSATAAAFQLWEQNASGLGTAYAGSAASAENASSGFFNPASLSRLPGLQLSTGVVGVAPSYRFSDRGSAGAVGSDGGNAGSFAAVPNAHVSWQLGPRLVAGLGISVPFGLATEYDSNWIGRAQSVKSEIRTLNLNPALAYRLNDKVALGIGVNYQTIDGELTNATARLKGDDASWGWNVGALFTLSPAMRVGVSYRSAMTHDLSGEINGVLPVEARLKLPDTFILSVWQQVSDRWEAMGDLSWTGWRSLDQLNIVSRSNGALLGQENFNYDNSWRFAWGAAYKASDAMKLKFGVAYDRSPVRSADRSARVPDEDRLWLSLGGQWKLGPQSTLDLGYAYLFVRDAAIGQNRSGTLLRGKYDLGAHILGAQYSHGF